MMGRGIVDPVDDFRDTNPPSNPELLKALTDEFVRGGYRIKPILRVIANSHAYQLASTGATGAVAARRRPGAIFHARRRPHALGRADHRCHLAGHGCARVIQGLPGRHPRHRAGRRRVFSTRSCRPSPSRCAMRAASVPAKRSRRCRRCFTCSTTWAMQKKIQAPGKPARKMAQG